MGHLKKKIAEKEKEANLIIEEFTKAIEQFFNNAIGELKKPFWRVKK